MHPEIYRELISQRSRELREQAHQAMLARMAGRLRRAGRRGDVPAAAGDGFVVPAIPDYADGSFLAADGRAAGGAAPAGEASGVRATRRAA